MTREEFLCEFRRIVNRYTKFVISGHIKPDGDSVGACVALALFLAGLDKTVSVVYDGASERYADVAALAPSFEPGEGYEVTRGEFVFIMLDCSEPKRTGGAQGFFEQAVTSLCIDHHVGGEAYAMYHYVEDTASSTCEILYSLFKQEDIAVTSDMAKALFLGVAFDTGGFRHSSTTADTFRMAAELKEIGVDSTRILNSLFHTRGFKESKVLSAVLRKAKLYEGQIVMSCMEQKDFLVLGAGAEDAEGVVAYLAEIKEAEAAVYLREIEPGTIRVNMRSKEWIDVAKAARQFGGGGHIRAAGCTVEEPMLLAKQKILDELKRQLPAGEC